MLLDHDPSLSQTHGPSNATPLVSAATRGHTAVVIELLSKDGSLLEISRSNGKNALHLAARQGHVDIVKALLSKDPQLARRTDKKGQTALHMAVKGQSCEVVKLLLDADAAIVMLPDKFGNTALHVATRKKRAEVIIFNLSPKTRSNICVRMQSQFLILIMYSRNACIMLVSFPGCDSFYDMTHTPNPLRFWYYMDCSLVSISLFKIHHEF